MKIEEATKKTEETIQEIEKSLAQCSLNFQNKLIELKKALELTLTDLHSMQEARVPLTMERLPDKGKNVIVYATAKYIGGEKTAIDRLEEGENHPIWMYTHGWFEVTHWMPLPEPPEEG